MGVVKNGLNDALEASVIVTFVLPFISKSNNTPAIRRTQVVFLWPKFLHNFRHAFLCLKYFPTLSLRSPLIY